MFAASGGINTNTCTTFLSLVCKGIGVDGDTLVMVLQNATGQKISITPFSDIYFDGACGYASIEYKGTTYRFETVEIDQGAEFKIFGYGQVLADEISITYAEKETGLTKTVESAMKTEVPDNIEISNDPSLTDFQLLQDNIKTLKQGKLVLKHFYDHCNGEIIYNKEKLQPLQQGILLIEGIYALRKELKHTTDLKVFVFSEEEKKYRRVSKRDAFQRSHGVYLSNKYFFEAQLTSYKRYIEPTITNADIIVNTTHLFD